jgi:hypothetical protein
MGGNRRLPAPEAYPAAFLEAVRLGGGLILAGDLPWTTGSARKRFYLMLDVLRRHPAHELHLQASKRWSVRAGTRALEISCLDQQAPAPSITRDLIRRALST